MGLADQGWNNEFLRICLSIGDEIWEEGIIYCILGESDKLLKLFTLAMMKGKVISVYISLLF